ARLLRGGVEIFAQRSRVIREGRDDSARGRRQMFAHLVRVARESAKRFVERGGEPLMQSVGVVCVTRGGVLCGRLQPLAYLFGISGQGSERLADSGSQTRLHGFGMAGKDCRRMGASRFQGGGNLWGE